jgi:hypothetical protein
MPNRTSVFDLQEPLCMLRQIVSTRHAGLWTAVRDILSSTASRGRRPSREEASAWPRADA